MRWVTVAVRDLENGARVLTPHGFTKRVDYHLTDGEWVHVRFTDGTREAYRLDARLTLATR